MPKLEKMIFSYDTSNLDKNSTLIFLVTLIVIILMLIYSMPLFIVTLVCLFGYNIYKSFVYYKSISIAKVLVTNVNKINNSIEEGIKNKVKSKRAEVENRFKLMLDKVDKKINTVEELISDTTAEVERDFVFNDSSIIESFKSKKDSIDEQMERNLNQIKDYRAQIENLKNKINEIDREIADEGKNIYEKYYPSDCNFEERSHIYLDDILIDIQDNEPIFHELPRGSSIYLFKDEDVMLRFINLYLVSLLNRMEVTSLYMKLYDKKYAGIKLIDYNKLDTFEQYITKEDIKASVEYLNKEMMKRIKILGSKHIDDYNKYMLADDSVPLPYYVLLDLFNKPTDNYASLKQLLVNGFNYGLIYHLFLDIKEIEGDKNCVEFIMNNFSEYYFVTDQSVSKKSSKFLSSLLK